MNNKIVIYTDGACKGNPGRGGWGAVIRVPRPNDDGSLEPKIIELCGGVANTTNNRMELRAVIEALNELKEPSDIIVHTDSEYVQKGISEWIKGWKARGWKTAKKEPVKNADLWQLLDAARQIHTVEWRWVKGHAGDAGNEHADRLANKGVTMA